MQVWEDGAFLVTVAAPGEPPKVIAKGSNVEPSFFLEEAGPHFLGDDSVRIARRNAVASAASTLWIAAYLKTRDETAGPGLARATRPAVQEEHGTQGKGNRRAR